jgi:hypothetical protein
MGRKWRQTNMKLITSIYAFLRPDLRDEWIYNVDNKIDENSAMVSEAVHDLGFTCTTNNEHGSVSDYGTRSEIFDFVLQSPQIQ